MLFKENHLKGGRGGGGYQLSHPLPSYAARLHKQNDLMKKAITHSRCADNFFYESDQRLLYSETYYRQSYLKSKTTKAIKSFSIIIKT